MGFPIYQGGAFEASGELATQADEQRVLRAFVGFMNTALGNDQTLIDQDAYAASPPGTFVTYTPGKGYAILGQPIANDSQPQQTMVASATSTSPGLILLLLAGLALLAFKS